MADQDQHAAAGGILPSLDVDLGHQRAGRVEHAQRARPRIGFDLARHAVGAEDRYRLRRHLVELVDEDGALGAQAVDHGFVVDNFVSHIHGRTVPLEGALDDLDGADDAGAKAAWLG